MLGNGPGALDTVHCLESSAACGRILLFRRFVSKFSSRAFDTSDEKLESIENLQVLNISSN